MMSATSSSRSGSTVSSSRKRVGQHFLTAGVKVAKLRDSREIRETAGEIIDLNNKLRSEQKIKMRQLADDIVALYSDSDDDLIWSTLWRVGDLIASGWSGDDGIHNILAKGGPLDAFETKLLTKETKTIDTSKVAKAVFQEWDKEAAYLAKKHKCPNKAFKCNSTEAPYETIVAASGDENHTTIYVCRNPACKYKWTVR